MSEHETEYGRQIVTIRSVRDYIKEQARERDIEISEYLREHVLPGDYEDRFHGFEEQEVDDEVVRIKMTEDVDDMIDSMTGLRVEKGEVLALYTLIDAIEKGEVEMTEEFIEIVPELLWMIGGGEDDE